MLEDVPTKKTSGSSLSVDDATTTEVEVSNSSSSIRSDVWLESGARGGTSLGRRKVVW